MKFTQFIKEFRSAHPDLNMSFKECMQSDDIKGAYKNIIGAGLSQKPAKIAEPKPVQEILGKEAAVGEWKKPPQERGIKGGTKAKRGKDCPPCPPCDRRRCVGDKGKRGGGQQQQKEYKLKGKENIQIIINNAAPTEGESKPPATPGVLPMKQEAPFEPFSSDPEKQDRIKRRLGNNLPGGGGDEDDNDDDGDSGNIDGPAENGQIESKEDAIPPIPNPIFGNENKFSLPAQTIGGVNWEDTISADELPPPPDINPPQQFYPAHKFNPPLSLADQQRLERQYWAHQLGLPPFPTTDINGNPYEPKVAPLPYIPNIPTTYPDEVDHTDIPVRPANTTPRRGNYTDTRGARHGVLEKRREKPVVKQTDPTRTDLPVDQPYEQDDEEDPSSVYTHPGVHTIIYPPAPQPPYGPYQYPFSPVQHVQHVVPYSVHFNPNPNDMYQMYQQPVHYQPVVQPPVQPRIDTTEPMIVVGPNAQVVAKPVKRTTKQKTDRQDRRYSPYDPQKKPTGARRTPATGNMIDQMEPVNVNPVDQVITQESKPVEKHNEPAPDVSKKLRKGKVVTEVPDVPAIAKPQRKDRSEDKMKAPDPINDKKRKGPSAASRNKLPTMKVQNLLMPMRLQTDDSPATEFVNEPSPELPVEEPVEVPPRQIPQRKSKEKLPFSPLPFVEPTPKRKAITKRTPTVAEEQPYAAPAPVPVHAPRSRTPAKRGRAVDEEQPAPVPAPRSRTVADVPVQRQEATPELYRDAAERIVRINYMMRPADAEEDSRGGTWEAASNRSANDTAMRLLTQQAGPIYNLRALGDAVRAALRASGRQNVQVKSGFSTGFYVGRGLRS